MQNKTFSSNKKHLIFLGFELLSIGILILIFVNFKITSVEEISQYNIFALLLFLFGAFTFLTGLKKRSFVFYDTHLSFVNKTTKFEIYYKDIYLVRIFRPDNTSQVTLGIVTEPEKEVHQISTAFFEPKVLLEVAKELFQISEKFEFLIEDEVKWLNVEQEFNEENQNSSEN